MSSISAMTEADKDHFCELLSVHRTKHFKGIKRVGDDGVVLGAVGFDNWTPNAVCCHIWLSDERGLTRHFLREIFTYLFKTCKLGVAIGVTPCNNTRALELNRRLGFRVVARIPDAYALGTDSAIQVMRREECRWIDREVRNGQELVSLSAGRTRLHGSG